MTWGNGTKGPWGNGPVGGGNNGGPKRGGGKKRPDPQQPDLDELFRKGQQTFKGMFGGGNDGNGGGASNGRAITLIGLVVGLLWLGSGLYTVESGRLGVVLRFGEYHRVTDSGLNYHLPFPIETVMIPNTEKRNVEKIGASSATARNAGRNKSLMLTGDRNIVDVDFEVQWKIDSRVPQDFLFNVRNPSSLIQPVAESAMREVIGRNNLKDILTTAQSQIADETKQLMQEMFDDYEAGIQVQVVNLSRPDVPTPVIDEFQDVKRAEQDRETAESVAEGYRNEIIPRAKGSAVQMIQEAEAYKNKVVADAEGDAARFSSVYEEYKLAKDVTKKRIYLETMEDVMTGMNKIIMDEGAGSGVLPYLPLNGLQSKGSK